MTRTLLHHGLLTEQFKPIPSCTDYFYFQCKQCQTLAHITAALIDNKGRIVFNLRCPQCNAVDALKTTVDNPATIHISPQHQKNIRKHWWDDSNSTTATSQKYPPCLGDGKGRRCSRGRQKQASSKLRWQPAGMGDTFELLKQLES